MNNEFDAFDQIILSLLSDSLRTPRVLTIVRSPRSEDEARLSFGFVAYTSRSHGVRSPQRWCRHVRPGLLLDSLRTPRLFTM